LTARTSGPLFFKKTSVILLSNMEIELKAQVRDMAGNKLKTLREKGFVPAIVYGAGQKNTSIQIDYREFEKVFEEAGESTIIKLKIGESSKNVLIHDIAKDPVTDKFIHVDFLQIRMDKIITTVVHLVFEGESIAVKNLDGVLVKNITEVEVEALPKDLPRDIKVDISSLETFADRIKIKDLKLSEGVKVLDGPEEVLASVAAPRTQEELEELEEKPEEEVGEIESEEGEKEAEHLEGSEEKESTGKTEIDKQ